MLLVDDSPVRQQNGLYSVHALMYQEDPFRDVERHAADKLQYHLQPVDTENVLSAIKETSKDTEMDMARTHESVHQQPASHLAPSSNSGAVSNSCTTSNGTLNPNVLATKTNAFDVLGDRRKRRKVSPELLENGSGESKKAEADEANMLQEPHSISNAIIPQAAQSDLSAPKKRRGRPPKAMNAQTQLRYEPQSSAIEPSITPARVSPRSTKGIRSRQLDPDAIKKEGDGNMEIETDKPRKNTRVTLKNGRLTQTLVVILPYKLKPDDGRHIGHDIESILAQPPNPTLPQKGSLSTSTTKSTHPFFRAKPSQDHRAAELPSKTLTAPSTSNSIHKPVDWNDLVFKPKRILAAKDSAGAPPAWPPLSHQHIGAVARSSAWNQVATSLSPKAKAKTAIHQINDHENILTHFSHHLARTGESTSTRVHVPERLFTTPSTALSTIFDDHNSFIFSSVVTRARQHALHCESSFDAGQANGPLPWTQKYAPDAYEHVLQYGARELHEWLAQLAVHNVKQGLDAPRAKAAPKRKPKARKKVNEMDDFIVHEDLYDPDPNPKIKNALLIVGPSGCGKTASVYAVAKQLDFEVFEIHPGMRRSQKDIFDKVGDMAQNHLVQGKPNSGQDSPVYDDRDLPSSQDLAAQPSLTSFFGATHKQTQQIQPPVSGRSTPRPTRDMKQSLVLFEEVDIVFDDDRGFWSGVQAFIQTSKRPVILTCNDLRSVPLDELDLFTVLHFTPPDVSSTTAFLCSIAASEGHIVQPSAVQSLYLRLHRDLRATITTLDFWCQMAVGSTKGGLDWFLGLDDIDRRLHDSSLRTYSRNSYRAFLDLEPPASHHKEDWLTFATNCADLAPTDLLDQSLAHDLSELTLQQACEVMETRSVAVCLKSDMACSLLGQMIDAIPLTADIDQSTLASAQCQTPEISKPHAPIFDCFTPLEIERSVFPPSQGRLAPSLDAPTSVLSLDISPYVRNIAAFDLRLEALREELFQSQGKRSRATRAARAAAEGGDKASTRRDRWFPPSLDLKRVLATGGDWEQIFHVETTDDYQAPLLLEDQDVMSG